MKLSDAQRALLATIPDDWSTVPIFGDHRPRAPLIRAGMVETRQTDVTPADWGTNPVVRVVHQEWRRTDRGRAVL